MSKASSICTISGGRRRFDVTIQERAHRIRLLLFDVDGVLTDGVVTMHADGSESKGFHIKDGAAIVWAQRAGLPLDCSPLARPTRRRSARRSWPYESCSRASRANRSRSMQILRDSDVPEKSVAYMGDDLLDLPVLARAGLSGAPVGCRRGSPRIGPLGQHGGRRPRRGAAIHRARAPCPGTVGQVVAAGTTDRR